MRGDLGRARLASLAMVFVLALASGLTVTAQSTWSHTYSGAQDGAFYGVTATADGGYVGYGWTKASGAGDLDGWLVRLDCTGVVIWQKTYGGPAEDALSQVLALRDGGFMVLGYTYSFGQGDLDTWLLRLDASGTPLWQRTYGGAGEDYAGAIVPTPDGGYALAGQTASFGAGNDDLWLVKLDGEGHILWQMTYGGTGDDYNAGLAVLPDGGFLMCGTTGSAVAQRVACILRLDASGQIVWQNRYSVTGQEAFAEGHILALPEGGSLFLGSTYEGSGGENAWLIRLDDGGGIVWQKSYGGNETDYFYSVVPSLDGGFAMAGSTYSSGAGSSDVWAMRVDTSGNALWQKTYGQSDWDLADGMAACADGGFFLAGRMTDGAVESPWAIKVAQDGSLDGSCTFSAPSSAVAFSTSAVATPTTFSPLTSTAAEGTTSASAVSSGLLDTLLCGSVGSCSLACAATVPTTAVLGVPVAFTAEATPEYCSGLPTFAWTFGDGATSTLAGPNHTYASGGSFDWQVTVTAGAQSCTKNGAIVVSGGATPPTINSMTKMGGPFRIVVHGADFQSAISLFIDETPWSNLKFTNSGLLKIKGGASLKAAVPKGVTKAFRFVNPDGGEITVNWSW